MTSPGTAGPERFRLLATFAAGRAIGVVEAPAGQPACTDGRTILVRTAAPDAEQRREVLLQSALLRSGSLDVEHVRALRARPATVRRYLALEGPRALAELGTRLAAAGALSVEAGPAVTTSAAESLERARGREPVADPPGWFGVIRPSRLLTSGGGPGQRPTDKQTRLEFTPTDLPEAEDDGDEDRPNESRLLRLFENPLVNSQALGDYLRRLFGGSRGTGEGEAGAELQVRALRRAPAAGPRARPLPTRVTFTDDERPGVHGTRHPEWDVHQQRYKPEWCRVIDFPLTTAVDLAAAEVSQDDVLRGRLSRVGLGPKVLRRRPDGDELDTEALVDLVVDVHSGWSPPERIYLERRKLARDLGVLVLLDASGSAGEADPGGLAVHEHQRRAAATIAATLEELGDRVAVYAFRSQGRHAVHLAAVKRFGERFGVAERSRLQRLQPNGYTRLGAAIRGGGEVLKLAAGTPNRLLLVLSDGLPYDDGYEGSYAESDARRALEELRADGVASLCLSIGTTTTADVLERVFGSAGHAAAPALADLSPRMDELFVAALREAAAPR